MSELPVYSSLKLAESQGLANMTAVSNVLMRRIGTVHMWAKRRRTTNFPMHKAVYRAGTRLLPLYDLKEVREWHRNYVPNTGGAPIGNRNWVPKRDKALTPNAD